MAHAAMHATIGVIEGERLVENAAKRGEQLVTGLRKMAAKHTAWPVRDVRGRGLMAAIEFDADAAFASKVRHMHGISGICHALHVAITLQHALT